MDQIIKKVHIILTYHKIYFGIRGIRKINVAQM